MATSSVRDFIANLKHGNAVTASAGAVVNFGLTDFFAAGPEGEEGSSPRSGGGGPPGLALPTALLKTHLTPLGSYPWHPSSAYCTVNRKPPAHPAVPWATNPVAKTGVSHTHAEFNSQANVDLRHYLKKAYNRMRLQAPSSLSTCTRRTGDSDPAIPAWALKRRMRARTAANVHPAAAPLELDTDRDSQDTSRDGIAAAVDAGDILRVGDRLGRARSGGANKASSLRYPRTQRPAKRGSTAKTSLYQVWSEEKHPSSKREGKRLQKAEPSAILRITGFDLPDKKAAVRREWSRDAIDRVLTATEKQMKLSEVSDRESRDVYEARPAKQRSTAKTSLYQVWSEEKHPSSKREGKRLQKAEPSAILRITGFDLPDKKAAVRREWSRDAIDRVLTATEKQMKLSERPAKQRSTAKTSLYQVWSEEKHPSSKRGGKRFQKAEPSAILHITGFDLPDKKAAVRREWSRDAIDRVLTATEKQMKLSEVSDRESRDVYEAVRALGAPVHCG
ncbi:hypothetical protein DIPPA_02579 [Diplonema papillatum]|nr:hypothetical protein DIPPA_02579 [Diplonema papillatum]